MSLLFDQNLSRRLPALLTAEFPGSEQVFLAGLATADDQAIRAYASAHGLAIVSKDADFANLAVTLGPPPKVVWLRVGNGPTRDIVALLRMRAADVRAFLFDPSSVCSNCHSTGAPALVADPQGPSCRKPSPSPPSLPSTDGIRTPT